MDQNARSSFLTLPGAVIIAGAIIGIAIIWTQKPVQTLQPAGSENKPEQNSMKAVTADDHILGNPNAPVKIVEYSDPSCPFCKTFNPVMEQIMDQYGPGGQVAWVYRQFPLNRPDQNGNVLHPNAGREAQALECAGALGGNTVFWKYEKGWFDVFPVDGAGRTAAVDGQQLAQVAKDVDLDAVAFNDCLSSGRFKDKVEAEYLDGVNAGVTGTPFIVIITPSGSKIPIAGAVSYTTMKTAIDALIQGTGNGTGSN